MPGQGAGFTRRAAVAGLAAATAVGVVAGGRNAASLSSGGMMISVNGDRQWLLRAGVKGAPIILLLHGGPGGSETVLFRHFNRDLERRFELAYWDQRGAGRSFDPTRPPSNMTVAQFLLDLDVVVDYLRGQTDVPLVILGHSWGSALGALYASRSPGKLAGYIGVSQVASALEQTRASFAWALNQAHRRQSRRGVAELESIGTPPYDFSELAVKDRWVEAFGGAFAPGFNKTGMLVSALLHGETSIREVRQLIRANDFSLRVLGPEAGSLDLPKLAGAISCPVAFLLGRLDHQVPSEFSAAYFRSLHAPIKELVWFERAAHNAPFEQPAAFNATVSRIVTCWVDQCGARRIRPVGG